MSLEQKRYFESGVKSEQERIIELLEGQLVGCCTEEYCDNCRRDEGLCIAIALIKVEQK